MAGGIRAKASQSEKFKAAGGIHWNYLKLSNRDTRGNDPQKTMDILALVPEMTIYEDIFSHTLHGELVMVDTHNIINTFPIVGMETIHFSYSTAGTDNIVAHTFKVYGVSDYTISGNKRTYRLKFVSVDAWIDLQYSENKAFKGLPGDLVKQALTNLHEFGDFYKITSATKPALDGIMSDQINEVKLVSPQWSTFQCIKWLEKAALNKNHIADYLFFESTNGYQFRSLSDMFKQEPADAFKYDESSSGSDEINKMIKIIDMRFNQVNDNLTRFLNRAYGHTIFASDIFHKQIQPKVWGWNESYKYNLDSKNQNTIPMLPEKPNFNIAPDHNTGVSYVNKYTHDLKVDTEYESTLSRIPALNFLQLQKMDVDIWGRTWISVGDTITINMGKMTQHQDVNLNALDLKGTSEWLITAIHHRLAPSQHRMTMQLVRNSSYE